MKLTGALALVFTAAMGVVTLASSPAPQGPPRVQPLFGVGANDTAPVAAPDQAAPFFDDTVVQEIRLTINTKDWTTLRENYLSNEYYPCDFRWNGQVVRNVGIRSRGNGSRSGIKPGLRVDFDRYQSNQKFLGLKSFVLRNNTQDQTNLRERVSMLLFKRMGALAPREAHVRLYVNDRYAGLYTIVESLDKTFLTKNLGEDQGYLYKYDYPVDGTPYYFEDRGDDGAAYVPLPFKPETNESNPRPEFIARWVAAVNRSSVAAFQSAVSEFVDFSQFLRHVAVEVFLGDYDGFIGNWGINNFYMYRADNQSRFLLMPWDKSEAMRAPADSSIFHNLNDVPEPNRNRLMIRMLQYPELYNLYLDTLVTVAASASEPTEADPRGWLEREIEREYLQIREAALTDTDKPFTNEEFEAQVQALLAFARERAAQIAAQVAASRR